MSVPCSVSRMFTCFSTQDTAAATEGHVSPGTSETPAKPFKESPPSSHVSPLPINGSGSPFLTAHDSPSVPETATSQSAVPQSNHSSHAARDTPAFADPVDISPIPTPAAVLEPTAKQPQVDHPQQATSSTSIAQASTSTPASGASTRKKRQSWFAKIKHIFDKDHDKQERKKNKH